MYIRRILILTAAIGLIFMGSFAFYVYKVMFMSNTSFEGDFEYIFIKIRPIAAVNINILLMYIVIELKINGCFQLRIHSYCFFWKFL